MTHEDAQQIACAIVQLGWAVFGAGLGVSTALILNAFIRQWMKRR